MFRFSHAFPILVVPVTIYNLFIALGGRDNAGAEGLLARPLGRIPMPVTEAAWTVSTADLILLIGLVAMFFEMIGSGRSSNGVLLKHVLNMLLFIGCLVEFLLLPAFATSTFFMLLTLTLMATIAGFVITTVTARKDIEFAN